MATAGELALQSFDAWRHGDRAWIVAHSRPDIVVSQPPAFPDARTYRGHDGLADAFDDWPRQWEAFAVQAVDLIEENEDAAILFTRHHLRGRGGLEFDIDVYNLFRFDDDGLFASWEMFMDIDEARSRLRDLAAPLGGTNDH